MRSRLAWWRLVDFLEEFFHVLVPNKHAELRLGPATTQKTNQTSTKCTDKNRNVPPVSKEVVPELSEVHFAISNSKIRNDWKTCTTELSGGQKTLLGLAFVLAIAEYQPSPLYLLDEVDAALDECNQTKVVSLVAQVLGLKNKCQTLAISHHADFQRGATRVCEIAKHRTGTAKMTSAIANSFDRVSVL